MTIIQDRFQVVCQLCGLVEGESNRNAALVGAQWHVNHADDYNDCNDVVVYDVMARRGNWQEWTWEGVPTERRPRKVTE